MTEFPIELLVALVGGGFALIGTLGGAFLGAYLNRRSAVETAREMAEIERFKYTQDRIWDFRKESYTTILASLKEASLNADRVNEGYHDEQSHPEIYHASDAHKTFAQASWESWSKSKEAFEKGRLTLSNDFVEAFGAIADHLSAVSENDLPPEQAWREAEAFRNGHRRLLGIALNEIAPNKPLKPQSGSN